jgi:hypothetical protein
VGKVGDSGAPPPYLPGLASRPPPEDQVRFIANIERILSEGSFVATYKYALLVALVELAIERGDDSNRELTLPIRDIADKFAELYWRQAAPYEADRVSGHGLVLHQNQGRQAGAITRLARLRDELKGSRSTLAEARRTADWKRLVSQMQALLKTMPLWRLQRVGHEDIRFLDVMGRDSRLELEHDARDPDIATAFENTQIRLECGLAAFYGPVFPRLAATLSRARQCRGPDRATKIARSPYLSRRSCTIKGPEALCGFGAK